MTQNNLEKRNFLFFLNEVHPLSMEDALIGALADPSSWDAVAGMVKTARQKDAFVRSIKKVQLYVHVPFCGRICTFCHCSKVLLHRRSEIDAYINALTQQMKICAPAYEGMEAGQISFGGGTPSLLDEEQLAAILDGVDKAFPARERNVLFEANPSSLTASKLEVLTSRGLSHLSVGVQSLDDKVLKRICRPQNTQKVLWCLRAARKANVPYVNVDLMAGLPGQTLEGLIEDLKVLINEGVNMVHVHPFSGLSIKELCAPGETILMFLKKRDVMMKATVEVLQEAGFRRKGFYGAYTYNGEGEDHQEEAYSRFESAVAGFGPFAKGYVPGAVYYSSGGLRPAADLPMVQASAQDPGYAMAHYAMLAAIHGLDEKVFLKRFGVSLERHCGEGLRYLKQSGLVSFSKGIWKFTGKWEIRRIREYIALSRVLFGEELLLRLRTRFLKKYDPRQDYSSDNFFLKSYTDNWLMTLYYQMGV